MGWAELERTAEHLAKRGEPPGAPGRIALPVSGDDAKAKEVVMKLVNDIGFDPMAPGGLDESCGRQPGTPVYAAGPELGRKIGGQ